MTVFRNEHRDCLTVCANFSNHHGHQMVKQDCGMDCSWEDFRWSDRAITEMMLLE